MKEKLRNVLPDELANLLCGRVRDDAKEFTSGHRLRPTTGREPGVGGTNETELAAVLAATTATGNAARPAVGLGLVFRETNNTDVLLNNGWA